MKTKDLELTCYLNGSYQKESHGLFQFSLWQYNIVYGWNGMGMDTVGSLMGVQLINGMWRRDIINGLETYLS